MSTSAAGSYNHKCFTRSSEAVPTQATWSRVQVGGPRNLQYEGATPNKQLCIKVKILNWMHWAQTPLESVQSEGRYVENLGRPPVRRATIIISLHSTLHSAVFLYGSFGCTQKHSGCCPRRVGIDYSQCLLEARTLCLALRSAAKLTITRWL